MKKKVLYISGTRADYGLMRSVLRRVHDDPDFDLTIIATGMHLMEDFGMTINEIRSDGFSVQACPALFKDDSPGSLPLFIGELIQCLTVYMTDHRPDMILLLGDRGEMLAGAIVGSYLGIPVIHLHGGEITSTVDEHARHAITKLAHIHLPATRKSACRIRQMGEDPEHIHVVGAPGLDAILNEPLIEPEVIARQYCLDLTKPVILVVQHPVSSEYESAGRQMEETLAAVSGVSAQIIIVHPNADAGCQGIIGTIRRYERKPGIRTCVSLPHRDYLSLLRISSALVGNSSSGIIEAPSFGVPVINIGTRQDGRERADNVLDVPYDRVEISRALDTALTDPVFRHKARTCRNPYGDGTTANKVVAVLKKVAPRAGLLQKKFLTDPSCSKKVKK